MAILAPIEVNPVVPPVEPVWTSSRFWITISTSALSFIGFLVTVGIIHSDDQENVSKAISGMVGAVGALAANAFVVFQYIRSRTQQRIEAAKSAAAAKESIARVAEAETRKFELIAAMPQELAMRLEPITVSRMAAVKS